MIRTLRGWWNDTSDIVVAFLIALIICVPIATAATYAINNHPSQPPLPTGVQVSGEIANLAPPMSGDLARTRGLRPLQDQAVG